MRDPEDIITFGKYPNKKIMDKIKKLDLKRKEVRLERKKYATKNP